jgi:hypothetical protein
MNEVTSMNESRKYWRDKVTQLLGWSTGLVTFVAGWALDKPEKFELGILWSEWKKVGDVVRAVALIVFSVCVAVALPTFIRIIYRRFLAAEIDETVLPYKFARAYALAVSIMILLFAVIMGIT